MRAFHNDPKLKEIYLSRVRAHAAADDIIRGQYWAGGKGCAIGCTIHGRMHEDYESLLGIPAHLAFLEDKIFENMSDKESRKWPELFLESIAVGVDLSLVFSKFVIRVLGDGERGSITYARSEHVVTAIQKVISLYERKIAGELVATEELKAGSEDAKFVSDWAVRAAYAAFAATDATNAVFFADTSADTARYAVRGMCGNEWEYHTKHFDWMAEVLIEELKAAPGS